MSTEDATDNEPYRADVPSSIGSAEHPQSGKDAGRCGSQLQPTPERRHTRLEKATFVVTTIGVFVGLGVLAIYIFQLKAINRANGLTQLAVETAKQQADIAQDALRLAREAMVLSQRSYLLAGSFQLKYFSDGARDPEFYFTITNSGHMPAELRNTEPVLVIASSLPATPLNYGPPQSSGGFVVGPGTPHRSKIPLEITAAQRAELAAKSAQLWIAVRQTYSDKLAKEERSFAFCVRYDIDADEFFLARQGKHNYAD